MTETRASIQQRIVERAQAEPAFRQALLDDPKAAIAQEVGTDVPEGVNIHVLEETPSDVYLVVPAAPTGGGTLSDEELAGVAGGTGGSTCGWGFTCDFGSAWGSCG